MSKHEMGLKPGLPLPAPLGAIGPSSHSGLPGPAGLPGDQFGVKGLDDPQSPPAAAVPAPTQKPKAFIILIRHITKGTLGVVTKSTGPVAEFEEMEHAINASAGIPACQTNPSFILPIYE